MPIYLFAYAVLTPCVAAQDVNGFNNYLQHGGLY